MPQVLAENILIRPMKKLLVSPLLMAAVMLAGIHGYAAEYVSYISQPGSKMRMEGTSTIHDWHAETKLIGGLFEVNSGIDLSSIPEGKLDAKVKTMIIVSSFSCSSGSAMDRVMREAMKADKHRFITFELDEITVKGKEKDATVLDAKGKLSVAGVTKPVSFPVNLTVQEGGKASFSGSTRIKMTDFGIQPPSPSISLGLIKTGDEVTLKFEWKVIRRKQGSL